MPLPSLIIIGAMKCGTTSMHHYLGRHPQIAMSATKALDFFIEERRWGRGVNWYASQFPDGTVVRGDSSPNYSCANQYRGVPARMYSVVPDARLLFMVRDPVERLISHWIHNYSHGREDRTLAEVTRDDRYVERSLYWMQISAFLEYYAPSRIHVVAMDDLANERRATMRGVFDFLGVEPSFYGPTHAIRKHRSAGKRRKTRLGAWIATTRAARRIEALPERWRVPLVQLLYLPFSRELERPLLAEAVRLDLVERLRQDANLFREFARRDFAGWSV